MRRPILQAIIDEIVSLFDRTPKGAHFNQEQYLRERAEIIRKHGYTHRAFERIAAIDYKERQEAN